MKTSTHLAIVLLSLVALAHLLRLVLQVEIRVEGTIFPMWISILGTVVPAALAVALWRDGRSSPAS